MHVLEVLDHVDLRVTRVIIEQSYNRAGYRHFRVDRLLLCYSAAAIKLDQLKSVTRAAVLPLP